MAVLAFFAIGSLIGGAIGGSVFGISAAVLGGAIGGLFGSFIDSQFLFPALFGSNQSVQGPRIDDLSVQTASEGSPIRYPYGKHNKFAGTVIWVTDLIETVSVDEQDVGKGGGGTITTTTYNYYVNLAVAVCGREINSIKKIYADTKLIYDNGVKDHRTQEITVYTGTQSQTPNPLIEAYLGAGNVPAYRGTAYVVIQGLHLADFGNRIPNITFYVEATSADESIGSVIGNILERAGLSPARYDVTALGSAAVLGYTLVGPVQSAKAIEPLMAAFNITAQELDGQIRFFYRTDADNVTISESDLAAKEMGGDPVSRFKITDVAGYDIPSEVDIRFIDYDFDLASGTQRARRIDRVTDAVSLFELPITMTAEDARKIAERRLWTSWQERQSFELTLPPHQLELLESDKVSVTYKGEVYTGRVTDVTRGNNSLLWVKGVITDVDTSTQDGPADPGAYEPPPFYTPPALTLIAITGPALDELHINVPGYYWSICATTLADYYAGATLFESNDNVNYGVEGSQPIEGKLGKALTVLSGGTLHEIWDRISTVDVELYHGTISSATEDQVLDGANRAFLGGELIGFASVTAIGSNQFRLGTLLRGIRDTKDRMSTHAVDEDFMVLSTPTVFFSHENQGTINTVRYLKAVPAGQVVGDVVAESLVLNARSCIGFAPGQLNALRNFTTNDWTISWLRRTRYFIKIYDTAPLEESEELYDIEILDGSNNVVRTFSSVAINSQVYSSANQVTDFGSNQTSIKVRVYQLTDLVGRGRASVGTF